MKSATQRKNYTLINAATKNLAFKLSYFDGENPFDHLQRLNYYSLILITSGSGVVIADFSEHNFAEDTLLAFSPYQPFILAADQYLGGVVLNFHSDFFCIHKHADEVACNGVLFNNIYNPPYVELDGACRATFDAVIEQIKSELQDPGMAQEDLLVSYLKVLLIKASRLKAEQQPRIATEHEPSLVVSDLQDQIELHYRTKHSASEYAELLRVSPKNLNRLTKAQFNKTLTQLIAERIVIEAKRELYLTDKSVKEIAHTLGYGDEYYFSRFFKKNTDVSPRMYRETVGFNMAAQG